MGATTITLTTDFGTREYYVGAVKGVILETNPDVRLVDVSHEIPSHDILAGAFTVAGACPWFPSGTIHLVVVDPGVGSDRRVLIASTGRHLYVAPDNGVLSLVLLREESVRVFHVTAEHYYRQPVCPTFHARDVFGPVAAWLAKGIAPDKFGLPIDDYKRLALPPLSATENRLEGHVFHVDKFGNLITTVTAEKLLEFQGRRRNLRIQINEEPVSRLVRYYAEAGENELVALVGSSGFLEVALPRRSAAQHLGAGRGARVVLEAD
ncbi:MAG: S-adenosyl-l-methionine hydroxide adenosyltransferase family protein [Acidobacteriota bacterium]